MIEMAQIATREAASPAVIGGSVAVAMGLVEVVKMLVAKIGSPTGFQEEDHTRLNDLHRWHSPTPSGQQEWKNPEIRLVLEAILETLRSIEQQRKEL